MLDEAARRAAGPEVDLTSLNPSTDIELTVSNVRLDADTGLYIADVQLRNTGPAIGRQVVAVFPGLPDEVTFVGPSGVDATGQPYLNFSSAIPRGGLGANARSDAVEVVIDNPSLVRFSLTADLFDGGPNQPPAFDPVGPLTVMPGDRLEVALNVTDPDGDPVTFMITPSDPMPTTMFGGNGTLVIAPRPEEVGNYSFTAHATDGALETSQTIVVTVAADPITTTRLSGVVQNTNLEPLAGVPIELGAVSTTTDLNGEFQIEFTGDPPADALFIRGEVLAGVETYPFIAEKLPLLLHRELYAEVNNVISRPIYLPALDMANAQPIDPSQDTEVSVALSPDEAPAIVMVAAGTLLDQQGGLYDGNLSITEVPADLTPAALPRDLFPAVVVTIQPGEMVFTEPAPLTLPNRGNEPPGTRMTLWSINPETGQFDDVGVGRVSDDGSVIETISGGIRNSSWHFLGSAFAILRALNSPRQSSRNGDDGCKECKAAAPAQSVVELHTGAVIEEHSLVTYTSLGQDRGLTLTYDSLRADPRPIIHFAYDNVPTATSSISAWATIQRGSLSIDIGGGVSADGAPLIDTLKWLVPPLDTDPGFLSLDAGIQADLSSMPTGQYDFDILSRVSGSSTGETVLGNVLHVNAADSPFGSGWGLAGLQTIVENPDDSVMLVDGDGSEMLFEAPEPGGTTFQSPPGDFSTLERLPGGTFRRTLKDQTVYEFSTDNFIQRMVDRNGNETTFQYGADGLQKIIDPIGLETSFVYTDGKVTEIVDPTSRRTTFAYDADGNLVTITDPDGTTRHV